MLRAMGVSVTAPGAKVIEAPGMSTASDGVPRLDDWVKDFDPTLAHVLSFIDLLPDPACARFYESDSNVRSVSRTQVKQPVNARGSGRWRPYAAALAPLIEQLNRAGALENWREAKTPRRPHPLPDDALPVSPVEGSQQ